MKKHFMKFFAFVVCFVVFISSMSPCSVVAYESSNENIISDDTISFIESKDRIIFDVATPLYNCYDEVIAYYYALLPIGYMICNINGEIMECSIENNKAVSNCKNYYIEPTILCYRSNGEYINIANSEVFVKDLVIQKSNAFTEKISDINENTTSVSMYTESAQTRARAYNRLSGVCRTYSYNPTGICGSTAAAIFFMYYNDYIDDYMVLSYYETTDGISLIQLLEPHIDGDVPGSNTADLVSGMNWYLRWKGQSGSYTAVSDTDVSYLTYRTIIDSGRPAIIDLDAEPTYNEHWVVGYGYELYVRADRSYQYYIVNDGHGSNSVYILSDYVGDAVYLQHL